MSARTKVFISYSHDDEIWLKRLQTHLAPLKHNHNFDIWDDRKIASGSRWREEIEDALSSAEVAVLLVSASFLASDFIEKVELPKLLDAAERRGAKILPVIISSSQFLDSSIGKFQAANDPSRPLITLPKGQREASLKKVADDVGALLQPASSVRALSSEKHIPKHPTLSSTGVTHSVAEKERRFDSRRVQTFAILSILIVLVVLGILIAQKIKIRDTGGVVSDIKAPANSVSEPTLRSYVAYITLEPTETPRTTDKGLVRYHVALLLEYPEGQHAVYEDRVKAPLGGTEIESNPRAQILNTNQYPDDANYLQFRIQDHENPGSTLNIEALAKGLATLTPGHGKIGPHLPYRTDYVLVVVDFSRIGFEPPTSSMRGERESLGPDGAHKLESLRFETHVIDRNRISIIDRNVPAGSSILLRWGTTKDPSSIDRK